MVVIFLRFLLYKTKYKTKVVIIIKMNKKLDSNFTKKLFNLAFPIAFQNLMLASVAAADAFMLGNVEQNMMAAVSLATQVQFIQNMIVGSLISVCCILGAQYWGKKDKSTLNDIFCMTLRLAGFTSLVFFILCEFFPKQLMMIFTNEEVLIQIGVKYLKLAAWSYLLTGFSQTYLAINKVSDHAKMTAWISTGVVILNIILNAIFIFGLFGLPKMSVQGAALATVISRIVEIIWCIIVSYKKDYLHPQIKKLFRWCKNFIGDFAKCFFPLLGAFLFWGVGFTSYTAFMGHLGTDAAAANSVASVVRDLVCCLCNGIASGGGILVGNELGAGKLDTGKKYGDRLVKLSFIAGFISTGIMLLLTPLVLDFVQLTEGARYYLIGMMIIMAFYMIGRTVNSVIINGIFASGGDTLFDMYSLAVCMWGLAVPLAALGTFVFHWNALIVYACTCLDEVGKIPWVLIHYKKYKWVKDLTRNVESNE